MTQRKKSTAKKRTRALRSPLAQKTRLSKYEKLRFFSEDSKVTMDNVSFGSYWAAGLLLLFSFLDFLVYPEFARQFLILRASGAVIVLVIGFVAQTQWARRKYKLFAMLIQLTIGCVISFMLYLLEEPGTPYYAGLNLCIVGTVTMVQATARETLFVSLSLFALYLIPTILNFEKMRARDSLIFLSHDCFFLVSTIVLVMIFAKNRNNFRYSEFIARTRLRKNQSILQEKNSEIKRAMTILKETEAQLFQSKKLSLIGELNAGVIHEIANPLNYTNNAIYVLRKKIDPANQDAADIIDDLQEGLDRIRWIITELREFSRTGQVTGEAIDFWEIIQTSLRILKNPVEESKALIELKIPTKIMVKGDRNQLVQVFSNLILNSLQAMATIDRQPVLQVMATPENCDLLSIEVTDNGSGMSSEDQSKLFTPFFSTKPPGMGTGLGLSICLRIVEAHGGTITVKTELGSGTTFTVRLPSAVLS
jgi:two-component system, sensor histidine kinase PhcS